MENNQIVKVQQELKTIELEITLEKLDSTELASVSGGYSSASNGSTSVYACCCCCCC